MIEAQIDLFVFGDAFDRLIGTDVEADEYGVGRRGEVDVVRGDRADAGEDHANVDLAIGEALDARAQRFDRTLAIGLDDEVERFRAAGCGHRHERFERDARTRGRGHPGIAAFDAAFGCRFASDAFVGDDHERIAGRGDIRETHDLDGNRRTGFFDLLAFVVHERADLAERATDHDHIADAQRAVLNEHGCHGAAAFVQRGFDDDTGCTTHFVCFEFAQIGFEQDGFEQLIDPVARASGDRHHFDFAAPRDGLQAFFGELLHHALGRGVGFVHLVDGNDDRHAGRFDVGDRFARLRHDAIVRCDDEDRNVGDFGAARTHRGKRFVTGRIDERDLAIVAIDGVGTDALRDAAGFARGDVGHADFIEQRGLPVIDVTEHRDDRRSRGEQFGFIFFLLDDDFFARFFDDRVEAELLRNRNCDIAWDRLIDRCKRAHFHELFDDVFGGHDDERGRQFLHGEQVGDLDRFELDRGLLRRGVVPFAVTGLVEQHVFFAVFFRLVVAMMTARTTRTTATGGAGAGRGTLTRRRRTVADGTRRAGRERTRSGRRERTERTVGCGTRRTTRHRNAGDAVRIRRRQRTLLIALAGETLAGTRGNAGATRDAGLRTGGRRIRAGFRRFGRTRGRARFDDRGLASWNRAERDDRRIGGAGRRRTANGRGCRAIRRGFTGSDRWSGTIGGDRSGSNGYRGRRLNRRGLGNGCHRHTSLRCGDGLSRSSNRRARRFFYR